MLFEPPEPAKAPEPTVNVTPLPLRFSPLPLTNSPLRLRFANKDCDDVIL